MADDIAEKARGLSWDRITHDQIIEPLCQAIDRQREEIMHLKQLLHRAKVIGLFPAGGQIILDVERALSDTREKE